MSDRATERALLVAVLALQTNFIDRDQFLRAIRTWIAARERSIESILREVAQLPDDTLDMVVSLAGKHLASRPDSADSLASFSAVRDLTADLRSLGDAELDATLEFSTRKSPEPPPGREADDATATLPAPAASEDSERFRVLRPHAKGGLGEVSVARDRELNREVALKEMQKRFLKDEPSRQRFLQEAEITGRLEHPGVVPVYSLGAHPDGRPFYAMRFIRGDSLKEAIAEFHDRRASLSAGERALRLRRLLGRLVDVCDAITYAHARGVLHRDLKPGNIMLGKYGETMVVDWGLAKPLGQGDERVRSDEATLVPRSGDSTYPTEVGTSVGTPGYMSPEQAEGRNDELGPATDVYSLGATLYSVLTGRSPIVWEDREEFLRKVLRGDIPRPRSLVADVPVALENVCLKALATRPADRYATARELADDLERWLADEPVSVGAEPWLDRATRFVRRHRASCATATVVLAALAIGAVVIGVLTSRANRRLDQAWRAAEDHRRTAEEQREKAESEWRRAEGNLVVARTWARRLLSLAENLARTPGQGELRRKMTDDSLKTFQDLYRQAPEDPDLRREMSQILRTWANVVLGEDLPAALRASEDAVKLLEPLAVDARHRDLLAETLRDQAGLLKRLGRYRDATGVYRRAAEIADGLRRDFPSETPYWRTAATIRSDYAALQVSLEEFEDGLKNVEEGTNLLRQLNAGPKLHPLDPLLLLLAIDSQCELLRELGRAREARPLVEEGLQRVAGVAAPTANDDYLHVRLLQQQGLVAHASDDSAAALAALDAAVAGAERLVEKYSGSTRIDTYRQILARSLTHRARVRGAGGAEATRDADRADLERAVSIAESLVMKATANTAYRETLALAAFQAAVAARTRSDGEVERRELKRALEVQKALVDATPEHRVAARQLERMREFAGPGDGK